MFKFEDILLTKDEILERISQEAIFEKYLGVYPQLNTRYTNPLRENKTPNTEFLYIGNTLYMRDWGGNEKNKNCFQIVQHIYNCSFHEALKHIENDFGLGAEPTNNSIPIIQRNSNKHHVETPVKKLTSIQIKKKPFTSLGMEFWNANKNFNFTEEFLESRQIYALEYIWYNQTRVKATDGQFAFQLKKGIFQIYSPFSENRRYRFRSTDLKGILVNAHLLKPSKIVLITKSFKDQFYSSVLGVNSTAFLNEGIIPTREQIDFLLTKGFPIFLYDNDEEGIKVSNKICEQYKEVRQIFLPKEYGKDVDEAIRNIGKKEVEYWMDENGLLE